MFLTARDSDFDVVSGLRLGADDYLTKDVSLPQLTARIAALFRRVDARCAAPQARTIGVPSAAAHARRSSACARAGTAGGGRSPLTEFWMVHALVRYPGHVKNRDQLMRDAQVVVDDATITSHVKRIRRKFQAIDPAFDGSTPSTAWATAGTRNDAPAASRCRSARSCCWSLTVFLALPWLGCEYVRELERVLRDAQERTLAGTAQAVATALHDRPRLFARPPDRHRVVRAGARRRPATGTPSLPPSASPEIEQIIEGLSRTTARIWVIDRDGIVLARAGSLKAPAPQSPPSRSGRRLGRATIGRLYALVLDAADARTSATTPPRAARRAAATSRARSPASSRPTGARRPTAGR